MTEKKTKCEFTVGPDQITFSTRTNGDKIYCKGMHVPADDSAALAYMIQEGKDLKITIKEV